jgi:hypothetical protein
MTTLMFILVKFLIPLAFMAYTAHLLYARYHPEVAERKYQKYKTDPQNLMLYRKVYSPQFLILALTLAATFVLDLGITLFELLHGPVPQEVKAVGFIINMILGVIGLYFAYVLFLKKR